VHAEFIEAIEAGNVKLMIRLSDKKYRERGDKNKKGLVIGL
jgi:hypothetical protein